MSSCLHLRSNVTDDRTVTLASGLNRQLAKVRKLTRHRTLSAFHRQDDTLALLAHASGFDWAHDPKFLWQMTDLCSRNSRKIHKYCLVRQSRNATLRSTPSARFCEPAVVESSSCDARLCKLTLTFLLIFNLQTHLARLPAKNGRPKPPAQILGARPSPRV